MLALPSVVVPFVPFACNATPVGAVHEWVTASDRWDRDAIMLTALATGLILPLFILFWRLRSFLRRPLGSTELVIAQTVAAVMGAGFLLALGFIVTASGLDASDWVSVGLSALWFAFGACACWRLRRQPRAYSFSLMALLVPYGATTIICLIAFFTDRKVGWYLTAVSGPAALAETITLFIQQLRARRGGAVDEIRNPALAGAPGEFAGASAVPAAISPPNPERP